MYKKLIMPIIFGLLASGCVQNDPSTYITDDNGVVHHTIHYSFDMRGRMYFPKKIKTKEKLFIFDPKVSAWAAYDKDGKRVLTGGGSGGSDLCEHNKKSCRTVTGSFRVYAKRGPNCISHEYPVDTEGGAKMPYCMYFYRGYTIHAAYYVPHQSSSHGCIRVYPSAAKWLNENFMDIGTRIIVLSYEDENGDSDWLSQNSENPENTENYNTILYGKNL